MPTFHGSSRRTPIYRDAGFVFSDIAEAERAFAAEAASPQSSPQFIYTRYGNPTVRGTESRVSELENSRWSLLTSSGMSAIDTAVSVFQDSDRADTWLFFSELYGGTNAYIDQVLVRRRGVKVDRLYPKKDVYDLDEFAQRLTVLKPSVVFFESISNPLLIVPAARQMIAIAKEHGAAVVVDNTFGTPLLWRPLEDGADIVVHSATKYLGGHGNITAGVVCGNDDRLMHDAQQYRKFVGCVLSPDDAYRLETQLATLELRFTRQCSNASALAALLSTSDKVRRTLYPGLASHPTYLQADTLLGGRGYGAMLAFELDGGRVACDNFVESVSASIQYVPTLGDASSSLLHVATVFGVDKYPEGMIRLSVGCERLEMLQAAISEGLSNL